MHPTLPIVTTAALLDSVNPCAISVLLLTVGFLISLEKSPQAILKIAGTYIFGIFVSYVLIGLGVLSVLSFFGITQGLSKFGAIILILSGLLSLLEHVVPNFPIHLAIPSFIKPQLAKQMQKATYPAMFFLGCLVGVFEFPCTGGPYLMILGLLHDKATYLSGAALLLYYNLIFVAPLVAILFTANNPILSGKFANWRKSNLKKADIISSLAMIILGAVIFLL